MKMEDCELLHLDRPLLAGSGSGSDKDGFSHFKLFLLTCDQVNFSDEFGLRSLFHDIKSGETL